jgi:nicotinamidase-related amidase
MIIKKNTALVLIDIQQGFDDLHYWGGGRNNPQAEVAASLLGLWRKNSLPVIHVKHCSSNPKSLLAEGNPGNEFKNLVSPLHGELVIRKSVNSAFIGTDLKEILDRQKITHLVLVGLTTDHCVSTTARMAGNYGYHVAVVNDATATFDKTGFDGVYYPAQVIHDTALASLNGEFATVINSEELVF